MLKNGKLPLFFEQYYPLIAAIVGIIIFICSSCNFWLSEDFDKVLNGVITFSSILVGFMGALLAILASIRNTEIVEYIYSHVEKSLFLKYFKFTIIPGLLVVVLSCVMFVIKNNFLGVLWTFTTIYFAFASYRIIDILLRIIFKDPNCTEYKPSGNELTEAEANAIRERLKK